MITAHLGGGGMRPLRIVCLGAHSDDVEIGCGGSLLRLLAEHPGSSVHWEIFSASDEREREARASASAFMADAADATLVVHHFTENYFPVEWADIKACVASIPQRFDPDIVFTHRRNDDHQDHRTLGRLAWNTFRDHLIAEYEIPKYEGDLGHPNLFVPLPSSAAERKIDLLWEHFESQRAKPWFRPELFRGLLNLRGSECNADQGVAEAFHVRKIVL